MNNKINPFYGYSFYFLSLISKIYNGYGCKKNQGFQRVLYKKLIYFKQMDISGYTIVDLCILMKTPLF